jgi:hypothetical protein
VSILRHHALPTEAFSYWGRHAMAPPFAEASLEHFARVLQWCNLSAPKNFIGSPKIPIGLVCANKSMACSAASFVALDFERLDLNCAKWAEEELSQPQHQYLISVLDS